MDPEGAGARQSFVRQHAGGVQTGHLNGALGKAQRCSHPGSAVDTVSVILAGVLSSSWVNFSPCAMQCSELNTVYPTAYLRSEFQPLMEGRYWGVFTKANVIFLRLVSAGCF